MKGASRQFRDGRKNNQKRRREERQALQLHGRGSPIPAVYFAEQIDVVRRDEFPVAWVSNGREVWEIKPDGSVGSTGW